MSALTYCIGAALTNTDAYEAGATTSNRGRSENRATKSNEGEESELHIERGELCRCKSRGVKND
jgi:hypothetical protein